MAPSPLAADTPRKTLSEQVVSSCASLIKSERGFKPLLSITTHPCLIEDLPFKSHRPRAMGRIFKRALDLDQRIFKPALTSQRDCPPGAGEIILTFLPRAPKALQSLFVSSKS